MISNFDNSGYSSDFHSVSVKQQSDAPLNQSAVIPQEIHRSQEIVNAFVQNGNQEDEVELPGRSSIIPDDLSI